MKKLFFALLSCTFLLASCGKDGAVGPQGATGATGATGNVNVSSTTFTVNPTDWVNGGTLWKVSFAVSSITQAVLDRGSIQVYYSPWATEWLPTPLTTIVSNVVQTWQPFYSLGSVRIDVSNFDLRLPANPGGPVKFRVVVIPAGLRKMPKVDWNNYAAVAKAFNLPD